MKKIQLSIPEPCHEQWEGMTPDNQGRFCNACQKTVVDFSTKNDRELFQFFEKHSTGVCGRFQQQQLERVIAKPKTPLPFVRYFFQITLPAFLLSMKATAQEKQTGKIAVHQNILQGDTIMGAPLTEVAKQPLAIGKVTDASGAGIPFAWLVAVNETIATTCDSNGCFEIYDPKLFQNPIRVSCVGYTSETITLKGDSTNAVVLSERKIIMLGAVVAGGVSVCKPVRKIKKVKPFPVIPTLQKSEPKLTLFPNPAQAGATVSITWTNLKNGHYTMQLQSLSGQQLWAVETTVDAKYPRYQFLMPHVPSGLYLFIATNKKTGESFSEKITVE